MREGEVIEKKGYFKWVLLNNSEAKAGPSDRAVICYDDMMVLCI